MEIQELSKLANEIKSSYSKLNISQGREPWNYIDFTEGFVGDVGDLMKLIMAKKGVRVKENHDELIKHELADCLWSVLVLADELGIDIEKEFISSMKSIKQKIS